MPELPEVETIRGQFEGEFKGDTIESVQVRERHVFQGDEGELEGETIESVSRFGKWLLVRFESGKGMEIHLKMTGRLVTDQVYENMKHTRVVFLVKSGRKFYYWDTRKFGYVRVLSDSNAAEWALEQKLGPEPYDLSINEFMGKLKKTGRKIKDVIIDQSFISGVGNIYANDGLWKAGIVPTKKANELTKSEAQKLLDSLREVMDVGLSTGGASDNTYRDFYGKRGSYQDRFLVYGGGVCKRCGVELEYSKVSGRGTWHCSNCQA